MKVISKLVKFLVWWILRTLWKFIKQLTSEGQLTLFLVWFIWTEMIDFMCLLLVHSLSVTVCARAYPGCSFEEGASGSSSLTVNSQVLIYVPTHLFTYLGTYTPWHPFYSLLSGTTQVNCTRRNIHPLTPILVNHASSAFSIYYDPQYPPCSIYMLDSLFCTTDLQIFFGIPLGLEPSTSHSIHFFTQSLSSFCNTCLYCLFLYLFFFLLFRLLLQLW